MFARSVGFSSPSTFNANIVVASNVNNFNLSSTLQGLGWPSAKRARVNIIINEGITVGSTSATLPAFLINLKDIDFVNIVNNGNIFGAGGAGGSGNANTNGSAGAAGGTALQALSNARVINNGVIGGGGGGAGGNGASRAFVSYTPSCPSGGTHRAASGTTCGRCIISGRFPRSYLATCTPNYSYPAGAAGAAGTAGLGTAGAAGASPWFSGAGGGAAGKYVDGLGKVAFLQQGTLRGNFS